MDPYLYHVITGGQTATVPGPEPGPGPGVPELPARPALAWRGDWLNFWHQGRRWYIGDQDATDAACADYRARGYTDVFQGTVWPEDDRELPFYNFVRNPAGWVTRAQGFNQRGLRVILGLSFEGAPKAWAEHKSTYLDDLKRFLDVAVPSGTVSSIALMAEPREMWHWDYQIKIVSILDAYGRDIALHDGEAAWGPQGKNASHPDYVWRAHELGWWDAINDAAPHVQKACVFQYRNYSEDDARRANGGFLSPAWDCVGEESHTDALLDDPRLPSVGVEFIAGEYAWNGTDPHKAVVPEAEGRALGAKILAYDAHGRHAIGAINGC